MKSISLPIRLIFQRREFSFFINLQNLLRSLFSSYFDQITLIEVKKKKLYIGVAIPQLVWHFNTLKENILSQVLFKMPGLIDEVIFIFHSFKMIENKKHQNLKQFFLKSEKIITDKKEISLIYETIRSGCYKKEYHDLLYNLYLKRVYKNK